MTRRRRNMTPSVYGLVVVVVAAKLAFSLYAFHRPAETPESPVWHSAVAMAQDSTAPAPQGPAEPAASGPSVDKAGGPRPLGERAKLEAEKRQIERERKHLEALRQELQIKIAELSELQTQIRSQMEKQDVLRDKKIKHLITIYSTMPAKKAGPLVEQLEMDVVLRIFMGMKGEQVGQIFPYLSAEKAAKISEMLVSYK